MTIELRLGPLVLVPVLAFTFSFASIGLASPLKCAEALESKIKVKFQELMELKLSRGQYAYKVADLMRAYPQARVMFDNRYLREYGLSAEQQADRRTRYQWDRSFIESLVPGESEGQPEPLKNVAHKVFETETQIMFEIRRNGGGEAESVLDAFFLNERQMMSSLAYRERNLVPNDAAAALWLMMDYLDSLDVSSDFKYYVAYNKKIWRSFVHRLNHTLSEAGKIVHGRVANEQDESLYAIHELYSPFYPSFGVTIVFERNGIHRGKGKAVFTRLFSNANPDPLNLLSEPLAPDRKELLSMYLAVAKTLSPGTLIEVHAHSKAHVRLYELMGFTAVRNEKVELFGRRTVVTLQAGREKFLAGIDHLLRPASEKPSN